MLTGESDDTLRVLASNYTLKQYRRYSMLGREGGKMEPCVVLDGTVLCTSSKDDAKTDAPRRLG